MALCVFFVLEDFPSTTSDFVCTRRNDRFAQSYIVTRQDELWHLDAFNKRYAALEGEVNVHHMALTLRCDVTKCISLLVVILIDDSDDFLLREVEDVRVARYIECRYLGRCYTMDSEVNLFVRQRSVTIRIDDHAYRHLAGSV